MFLSVVGLFSRLAYTFSAGIQGQYYLCQLDGVFDITRRRGKKHGSAEVMLHHLRKRKRKRKRPRFFRHESKSGKTVFLEALKNLPAFTKEGDLNLLWMFIDPKTAWMLKCFQRCLWVHLSGNIWPFAVNWSRRDSKITPKCTDLSVFVP